VSTVAKISARGAREVARITATRPASGGRYIYVLTDDGRVLYRAVGVVGTSYTIRGRIKNPASRTRDMLALVVKRDGLTAEGDQR
jgi:hypothetical protein